MNKGIVPFLLALVLFSTPVMAIKPAETITAPETLSGNPKTEHTWGIIAGWADLCSYNTFSSEVTEVFERSPHFRDGKERMTRFSIGGKCGRLSGWFKSFEKHRAWWTTYIKSTYPEQN